MSTTTKGGAIKKAEWRTACLARRAFIATGRQDLVKALDEAWAVTPEPYSRDIAWSDADALADVEHDAQEAAWREFEANTSGSAIRYLDTVKRARHKATQR